MRKTRPLGSIPGDRSNDKLAPFFAGTLSSRLGRRLPTNASPRYNTGMSVVSPTPRRIAVIGGGIAGLAAAHRLAELDPGCEMTLFEAGARLGGVLSTVHEEGFQVEQSADNFITTIPWGLDLCKRLGLGEQLVQTNPAHRRTFVVRRGRLCPLPDGFLMMAPTRLWPLALTPILSPLGKLRAALEWFIPPREDDRDESMAEFVRRRLGRETFDRLVEPLVSAVYAADLEKLSVAGYAQPLPGDGAGFRQPGPGDAAQPQPTAARGSSPGFSRREIRRQHRLKPEQRRPATACSSPCARGSRAWSMRLPPACRRAACN